MFSRPTQGCNLGEGKSQASPLPGGGQRKSGRQRENRTCKRAAKIDTPPQGEEETGQPNEVLYI